MNSDGWNNWLGLLLGTLNGYLIFELGASIWVVLGVVFAGTLATRQLADWFSDD